MGYKSFIPSEVIRNRIKFLKDREREFLKQNPLATPEETYEYNIDYAIIEELIRWNANKYRELKRKKRQIKHLENKNGLGISRNIR